MLSSVNTDRQYIWLTRSGDMDDEYKRAIEDAGYACLSAPLLEISEIDFNVPADPQACQAIMLTSANAACGLKKLGAEYKKLPIFTVGEQTAGAVRSQGFEDVHCADGDINDLEKLIAEKYNFANGPILYLSARHITKDPAIGDIRINRRICYETLPVQSLPESVTDLLSAGRIAAITLFSVRGGQALEKLIRTYGQSSDKKHVHASHPKSEFHAIKALCLSDKVLNSIEGLPFSGVQVAKMPTRSAMIDLICNATIMTETA